MEKLGTKTFFPTLFLCGSCSVLWIRSNQISSETATGVSSVCNPGDPSAACIHGFSKCGVLPCRVPCCISCTLGVDQSLLPSSRALLLMEWDCSWPGLCSQLAHASAAGAEDWGNKSTPQNSQCSIHNSVLLCPFLEGLFHSWPVLQTTLVAPQGWHSHLLSLERNIMELPTFQRCLAGHSLGWACL